MRSERFHDAYLQNLQQVYHHPQFINAPRGFRSREVLNSHITLTNPRERVCYAPARKTNIVFNFAEALWYLSGDNTLDHIGYYARDMAKYSMDGATLTGTAYGPKLFAFGPARINQWQSVVDLLATGDPDSKRAVIAIFDANEWSVQKNLDVSCTLALQFLVREGRLYMVTYMRANDAFRGIVSDVFSFTFIQEFLARQLGLEVGEYYHNVGSMHVYDSDEAWVTRVLDEGPEDTVRVPTPVFPAMPAGDNWGHLRRVLEIERRLRTNALRLTSELVERSELPPYWQQVIVLFGLYQGIAHREAADRALLERLDPVYRALVVAKWRPMFLAPTGA